MSKKTMVPIPRIIKKMPLEAMVDNALIKSDIKSEHIKGLTLDYEAECEYWREQYNSLCERYTELKEAHMASLTYHSNTQSELSMVKTELAELKQYVNELEG